jgi:hypothetical protein
MVTASATIHGQRPALDLVCRLRLRRAAFLFAKAELLSWQIITEKVFQNGFAE